MPRLPNTSHKQATIILQKPIHFNHHSIILPVEKELNAFFTARIIILRSLFDLKTH
jgi:hypothetical protein